MIEQTIKIFVLVVLLISMNYGCIKDNRSVEIQDIESLIQEIKIEKGDENINGCTDSYKEAVKMLGKYGSEAKEAIPVLLNCIEMGMWDKCKVISKTLVLITEDIEAVVRELIRILESNNDAARRGAIETLIEFGAGSLDAIPALIRTLEDEDTFIRAKAGEAIGKIANNPENILPKLISILENEKHVGRDAAAWAIYHFGPAGKNAIPTLIELLNDEDTSVRRHSAMALGTIGKEAKDAIPTLVEGLRDLETGHNFAWALRGISVYSEDAVVALIDVLGDESLSDGQRSSAAAALGKINHDLETIMPALINALEDEHWAVRGSVVSAFGEFGPDAEAALPYLIDMLENEEGGWSSINVATAIWRIEGDATIVLPTIIEGLEDESMYNRYLATCTIAEIGPAAIEALPELRRIAQEGPIESWAMYNFPSENALQEKALEAIAKIEGTWIEEEEKESHEGHE